MASCARHLLVRAPIGNGETRFLMRKCWFSTLPKGATAFRMPALSPTMSSGGVSEWLVKEMEEFSAGQALCEIDTDKASMECEAQDDGVMAKIIVPAGSKEIDVGVPIAVTAEDAKIAEVVANMDLSFLTNPKQEEKPQDAANESKESKSRSSQADTLVSPSAAFLLRSYGVNASDVTATQTLPSGKHKVLTKGNALKAIQGKSLVGIANHQVSSNIPMNPKASTAASTQDSPRKAMKPLDMTMSGSFEDLPASMMRKVIATRLTQSKQESAHFYASIDCKIDEVLELRKRIKKRMGIAPSINDVIIKASALALRDVPRVNCRLDSDGKVVPNTSIDVAVAVATPTGLITPIVKDSDNKGMLQISSDMRELATRAKENKLKLDEFQGGSFTVSNLGMFGINNFTAIISAPQSAILAVGKGRQEFVVHDGNVQAANIVNVQISCNRAVIDDATAGRFLQTFRHYVEEPENMLL